MFQEESLEKCSVYWYCSIYLKTFAIKENFDNLEITKS